MHAIVPASLLLLLTCLTVGQWTSNVHAPLGAPHLNLNEDKTALGAYPNMPNYLYDWLTPAANGGSWGNLPVCQFVDVNGDSLPDVVCALIIDGSNNPGNQNTIWLNTGYGWVRGTQWTGLHPEYLASRRVLAKYNSLPQFATVRTLEKPDQGGIEMEISHDLESFTKACSGTFNTSVHSIRRHGTHALITSVGALRHGDIVLLSSAHHECNKFDVVSACN